MSDGYEIDDPKHPDYRERIFGMVDDRGDE